MWPWNNNQLARIEASLAHQLMLSGVLAAKVDLLLKGEFMSPQLQNLSDKVTALRGVVDSAIALLGGLAQQIRDLKDDPAQLVALADAIDKDKGDLADGVAANSTP